MCGLAGVFDLNQSLSTDDLKRVAGAMGAAVHHRGPDEGDTWVDAEVGYGVAHRRLSIQDLSAAGRQPMISASGRYVLSYNGEIYNYRSLRENLSKNGVCFSTTSDTEVLLELYRIKGAECLNDLEGMFAFAIYNKQTKNIFLARDPFGIKPLFYYSNGEKFAFASELKTLTKAPGIEKEINFNSLTASLNYLWIPGNETMFSSIDKLAPGSYAIINTNGQFESKQYYKPSTLIKFPNENEAIEAIDHALQNSVKRHLEADVPVSAFLSGGLDSSLLSVLAHQHLIYLQHCYQSARQIHRANAR